MHLENLRDNHSKLIGYLEEHDYEKSYIAHFRSVLSIILRKSKANGWSCYEDVYRHFVNAYSPHTTRKYKTILAAIRNFDLYEKYPDGKCASLTDNSTGTPLCDEFSLLIKYYKTNEYLRNHLKSRTIESHACCAGTFFRALQAAGITTLNDIDESAVLSVFLSNEGELLKGASYANAVKKVLLRCSEHFPTESAMTYLPVAKQRHKNIQYLTPEETKKIRDTLTGTDRTLTLRDKAIGILAYYTGLRGSDIAGLNLDSFDLENDAIHVVQKKTGKPLDIPLKAVVGNAICDYVMLERPQNDIPALFLTKRRQRVEEKAMYSISCRIMAAAGIRQGENQRKGLHLFRHHLATTLLENGISQTVISNALGHDDPKSVEAYLSSDFLGLKSCALSVDRFPVAKGGCREPL